MSRKARDKSNVLTSSCFRNMKSGGRGSRSQAKVGCPAMEDLWGGRSMVNSIAIALSKTQQMASTLCSLYLMRRTSMFSSHEFVSVHLGQSMSIAQHEEYEAALVATGNDKMVATTQMNDYMCRPEALLAISMVEFVVSYERKRGVAPIENEEDEFFSFNSRHPLCTTHFLRKRNSTVIPDIIGPRIPDRRKLKSQDEKESMGYWDAFEEFETSSEMTESRKKYLRNHQEYYVSKENAALERKILGGVFQEFVAEGDIWDDHGEEELQPADAIESTDSIKPHDACEGVSVNAVASEELGHMHSGTLDLVRFLKHTTCIDITAHTNSAQRDTDRSGGQRKLWPGATDYVFALSTTENAHATELAAFQRKTVEEPTIRTELTGDTRPRNDTSILDVPNTQIRDSISFETSSRERAVTTVEKMQLGTAQTGASTVEKSISEAACIERGGSTAEYYPSIEDVMQRFSLNKLQGVAFREVGAALVQRLQCDNCSDMKKPADGFAMYLGGEGGTGKSRVIKALVYLSKAWRKETSVRVCAPTGIAASLVGGQTFHSLVNIRPWKEYKKNRRLKPGDVALHAALELLILDEVSMLPRKHLENLDHFLRSVREVDQPYGNVIVLFCVDFFQIPPVRADPVYADPIQSKYRTLDDVAGYELWKNVKRVVILEENMWQEGDKRYGEFLRKLRRGDLTREAISYLNERQMRVGLLPELGNCSDEGCVAVVVPNNALRHAVNWMSIKKRSQSTGEIPIVCIADFRPRKGNHFSLRDVRFLLNTTSTQTGNLAILLPVLPDMPIRITQNIAVGLGIANGTEGILAGIQFDASTTFSTCTIFGMKCRLASKQPVVTFVDLRVSGSMKRLHFESLPTGMKASLVPLTNFEIPAYAMKIWKRTLDGGNRIRISQMPFVPAFASTTYKVQGCTVPGIVSLPFFEGGGGSIPRAALYVVLSRVKIHNALFLTETVTERHQKYFQPGKLLMDEEERLKELHKQTVRKYGIE